MAEAAPDEFSIARDILTKITASLGDGDATVGQPKQIAVVLV
jgi:hypothetical protein